jgi:hypothetical protein
MLKAFVSIARSKGMTKLTLTDGSYLGLFRDIVGTDGAKLPNLLIRSTLLSTLLTGEPDSYYKGRGFVYSDVGAEKRMKDAAAQILTLSVGDLFASEKHLSHDKWDFARRVFDGKGAKTKFHKVFRELHDSAKGGNNKDRQMLIDIFDNIVWKHVPGNEDGTGLSASRKMKMDL